jgi:hypothetical protein
MPAISYEAPPQLERCKSSQVGNEDIQSICNSAGSTDVTATPVSTSGGSGSGASRKYVPYDRLSTAPDGQPCVTTGYVEEGVTPNDAAPPDNGDHIEGAGGYNNIFTEYPPCPEQPRAPGQPAPVETRAMVAARQWEQRTTLPRPTPYVAPGRAITGKTAYLETRGDLVRNYRTESSFGPLVIVAHGTYFVDWGDGETSGPHTLEGGPWPNGHITHDYVKVGSYNIVVTEKWTATWSLDGESGILRTLQTTGRIDNFPVEQLQAVIGR